MITVSLSHLLSRGVRLDTQEAVAIVRTVSSRRGEAALEGIELSSDGDVGSGGGHGPPTVEALARLLDALLPPQGVPAPLRYAVARGLGTVAAPPFASAEEFSSALARFAAGDDREIVKRLIARGARPPAKPIAVSEPAADVELVRARVPEPSRHRRIRAWHVLAALALSAAGGFAGARAMLPAPLPLPPRPAQTTAGPDTPVSTLGTFAPDGELDVSPVAEAPAVTSSCPCPPAATRF
jgi:hypothetical protein